jgi:hypothetical protein
MHLGFLQRVELNYSVESGDRTPEEEESNTLHPRLANHPVHSQPRGSLQQFAAVCSTFPQSNKF